MALTTGSCCGALVLIAASAAPASEAQSVSSWAVPSPSGAVQATLALDRDTGAPSLSVELFVDGVPRAALEPSPLGLTRVDASFQSRLRLVEAGSPQLIEESYELASGKRRQLSYRCTERSFSLENADGAALRIDVRAFDDAVAFRYVFPDASDESHTVVAEHTGFRPPAGARAWIMPYDKPGLYSPSYENYYMNGSPAGADAPDDAGWALPALFEADGVWVLLAESGLERDYCGIRLAPRVDEGIYRVAFPLAGEALGHGAVQPRSTLPWTMPWRVVVVGPGPGTIVETNVVDHLGTPSRVADASWVRPGVASWSWWSDHESQKDYESLRDFVDLAAEMGWEYSLVDADWQLMQGGDVRQLVDYAAEKGVGIFLWYNGGGPHNEVPAGPRDIMNVPDKRRAELKKLREWGVKGIKVDFFNSDKQDIVALYHDLLADAAEERILVVCHGSTVPRGWTRTYPNLVSMEAVRGAEIYSCCEEYGPNAPWHNTILPFTRNAVGPMDYTPVTFTDQKVPHRTSFAHELALAVVFESGVVHMADATRGYRSLPEYAKAFLRAVPAAWDETRFVAGEPGSLVVIARRLGEDWFVGGINGRGEGRVTELDLSFLDAGSWQLDLISDGPEERSLGHETCTVSPQDRPAVMLLPRGGFVATLVRAAAEAATDEPPAGEGGP